MILDFKIDTEQEQTTFTSCPYCNNFITEKQTVFTNLKRELHSLKETKKDFIFIKYNGLYEKILFEAVLFIESKKNYLLLTTTQKEYRFRSTVKDFLAKLPDTFIKTHKCFIVNPSKIDNFNGNTISIGDKQILISNYRREEVLIKLKHFLLK